MECLTFQFVSLKFLSPLLEISNMDLENRRSKKISHLGRLEKSILSHIAGTKYLPNFSQVKSKNSVSKYFSTFLGTLGFTCAELRAHNSIRGTIRAWKGNFRNFIILHTHRFIAAVKSFNTYWDMNSGLVKLTYSVNYYYSDLENHHFIEPLTLIKIA